MCSESMRGAVGAALDVASVLIYSYSVDFSELDRAIDQATTDCDNAETLAEDLAEGISDLGL